VNLTRLIPGPSAEFDLESEGAAAELSELYRPPRRRWLRLNFVASINGNVAGPDGTSDGLTSRTDRRILGTIRRLSDVVLVGASSVRKEGYFLPKTAPLAIVTGSGDLSGHQIPADVGAGRVIVLCPPDAQDALGASLGSVPATVITLPGPRVSPAEAVTALHRLGHDSIVCEGGPSLAAQLIDADLVDELCLSTSPVLNGTDVPVLPGLTRGKVLHLSQLLVDPDGVLYARWTVRN
jgi:Pyrimidine reductase, riboflavin biosynthesis